MGGADSNRLAEAIGNAIGKVSLAAAASPQVTLAVVAVITVALGAGLLKVEFEENLLEILPRNHPYTRANLAIEEQFPGHHSFVNINFKINASRWAEHNAKLPNRVPAEMMQSGEFVGATNVTDEVYIRALEEYFAWMQRPEYLPAGVSVFNIAYNAHVKLINYTNTYNPASGEFDPDSYRIPGSDPEGSARFALNWRTVFQSAPREVSTQASPDWDVHRSVYVYVPSDNSDKPLDYNEIGRLAMQAFLEYREAAWRGDVEWNVWNLDESGITNAQIVADAHQTDLAKEDLKLLAPLVLIFIAVALWFAFRSPKAILVGTSSLLLGTIWTYGLMGYLSIPLNVINLTIVPLILGVGIDYSIHMTNEYLEHRSKGLSDSESFREAGRRSGFAMLVATVTTIAGLVLMIFSPSLLIAQMGLLSVFALAFVYLLAITYIPAALVALRIRVASRSYSPDRVMPAIGALVSRHRVVVGLVVLVVSGLLVYNARLLEYETFGNPALNFGRGDPVRDWYDQGQAAFFGTETASYESNWVILEGDLTTPEAHAYILALQEELRKSPKIRDDSVTSIHNLVKQWVSLKRGTPVAVASIVQDALAAQSGGAVPDTYPKTQEEIRQALDEMYACPCFSTYASLFINREYDITVMLIDTDSGLTYAGSEAIITDVEKVIAGLDGARPEGVTVSLGGYTTFSYLFIKYEMPWVQLVAFTSMGAVVLIVLVFWRDWRAAALLGGLMFLTSLWWLGSLPYFGIGLAITLTLPLVFINCIGSDYGVHLLWAIKKDRDARTVFETTGKGVLFSVVTTLGAFALFIPMQNLMMKRSMIATTISIAMIFAVTLLVVPLFHRVRAKGEPPEGPGASGDEVLRRLAERKRDAVQLVPQDRSRVEGPAR